MTSLETTASIWACLRSGAVAGAASAFTFAIIHHLFISDIWFSVVIMMVAGAICGLCIGWSYALLVANPSVGSWLQYNMLYLMMFVLLGVASVLIYEPVTTIPALLASDGPPDELFRQAMPLTLVFILATAIFVYLLYKGTWLHFGSVLVTCIVLVLLLGLNVSILGLVYIPRSSVYLVGELFGLIFAINSVYVVVFIGFEWKRLIRGNSNV